VSFTVITFDMDASLNKRIKSSVHTTVVIILRSCQYEL